MADEYIRREDAKDALQEKVFHNLTDEFYGAMQAIDELPSADVAPVVHAQWIVEEEQDINGDHYWTKVICSRCNHLTFKRWNYCPQCGARMDGKEGKE